MTIRKLRADEIDARVATINEKGCSLLLYKDARCDMNILDEVFGSYGWKRSHQLIGDNLYCTVEVKDPNSGEWISKQDVGTESYTEKEKGQASDSFKRACFNIGIGRELYTAPFIWISAADVKVVQNGGKFSTYDKFKVTSISYDDAGKICGLTIYNKSMKREVYKMGAEAPAPRRTSTKTETKAPTKSNAYPDRNTMMDLAKKKYPEGSDNLKKLLDGWKIENLDDANDAQLMVIWGRYGGKD